MAKAPATRLRAGAPGAARDHSRRADSLPARAPGPGRPRLTADVLRQRLAAYCELYGVSLNGEGFPPFPAGRRETDQHRAWMALYKAQRRLSSREHAGGANTARLQELLAAQRGRCVVCHKPLEPDACSLDAARPDAPAVLHSQCLALLQLARTLGPEALERARSRL